MIVLSGCGLEGGGLGGEPVDFVDAQQDTVVADTSAAQVDSTLADTAEAMVDSVPPIDTSVKDSAVPDTMKPDTTVPDTTMPDTATPDTSVTDTRDAAIPCTEPGSAVLLGHCYFPITTPAAFAAQRDACIAQGAHLAATTSAAEQVVVAGRGTGDRWIGLVKDSAAPSAKTSFRWITGESSLIYDNWAAGDPNGGHNCARMNAAGQWADMACTTAFPAVCERE